MDELTTHDDCTDVEQGDEITVEYENTQGGTTTLTAEVTRVEITDVASGGFAEVYLRAEDTNQADYYDDGAANRRLTVYDTGNTSIEGKNGGRWHRLHDTEPTAHLEGAGVDEGEAVACDGGQPEDDDEGEDVQALAEECRDSLIGTWAEVGLDEKEGNLLDVHGDLLAHLNHVAEGDQEELDTALIESLVDAFRLINQHGGPSLGALAPLDQAKKLRAIADQQAEQEQEQEDEGGEGEQEKSARERLDEAVDASLADSLADAEMTEIDVTWGIDLEQVADVMEAVGADHSDPLPATIVYRSSRSGDRVEREVELTHVGVTAWYGTATADAGRTGSGTERTIRISTDDYGRLEALSETTRTNYLGQVQAIRLPTLAVEAAEGVEERAEEAVDDVLEGRDLTPDEVRDLAETARENADYNIADALEQRADEMEQEQEQEREAEQPPVNDGGRDSEDEIDYQEVVRLMDEEGLTREEAEQRVRDQQEAEEPDWERVVELMEQEGIAQDEAVRRLREQERQEGDGEGDGGEAEQQPDQPPGEGEGEQGQEREQEDRHTARVASAYTVAAGRLENSPEDAHRTTLRDVALEAIAGPYSFPVYREVAHTLDSLAYHDRHEGVDVGAVLRRLAGHLREQAENGGGA